MSNYKFKDESFSEISSDIKIAFVVGEFNYDYTSRIYDENVKFLESKWFKSFETFMVPWAFEIPWMVKKVMESWDFDLTIAIWVVVRWETIHFDIISNESSRWLMNLSLDFEAPLINWILTCENFEQVEDRINSNFALSWLKLLKECQKL